MNGKKISIHTGGNTGICTKIIMPIKNAIVLTRIFLNAPKHEYFKTRIQL